MRGRRWRPLDPVLLDATVLGQHGSDCLSRPPCLSATRHLSLTPLCLSVAVSFGFLLAANAYELAPADGAGPSEPPSQAPTVG